MPLVDYVQVENGTWAVWGGGGDAPIESGEAPPLEEGANLDGYVAGLLKDSHFYHIPPAHVDSDGVVTAIAQHLPPD